MIAEKGTEKCDLQRLQTAARLKGKAPIQVALLILSKTRELRRRQNVRLTPRTLMEYGLNRVTVYRALTSLEQAGLIEVRRGHGTSPLVSVIDPEGEEHHNGDGEHYSGQQSL